MHTVPYNNRPISHTHTPFRLYTPPTIALSAQRFIPGMRIAAYIRPNRFPFPFTSQSKQSAHNHHQQSNRTNNTPWRTQFIQLPPLYVPFNFAHSIQYLQLTGNRVLLGPADPTARANGICVRTTWLSVLPMSCISSCKLYTFSITHYVRHVTCAVLSMVSRILYTFCSTLQNKNSLFSSHIREIMILYSRIIMQSRYGNLRKQRNIDTMMIQRIANVERRNIYTDKHE